MRSNRVGWLILSLFLFGGIYFWITMPEVYIGQIWVAVSVFLLVVMFFSWVARIGNQGTRSRDGSPITVHHSTTTSTETIRSEAAGAAVMEALREHGIDPSNGVVDLRNLPAAREAIMRALKDHGIDAAHHMAAQSPATPIEETGEPMERLLKLDQLKEANLISGREYDEYRKSILKNL